MGKSLKWLSFVSAAWAVLAVQQATALSESANGGPFPARAIPLVIGTEAGTGFDVYGRLVARHLGSFLPGSPAILPENMPGAGGLTSINWLAHIASHNTPTIATFSLLTGIAPLLTNGVGEVDLSKLVWLANLDKSVAVCVASADSKIATFRDLLSSKVVFGGFAGAQTMFPNSLMNMFGARGKLVLGYHGSNDLKLAIDRGEVNATCGDSIQTLTLQWSDDLSKGRIKPILQFSRERSPLLPNVPSIYDYARNSADRDAFDLIYGLDSLGRPFAAPPGMSKNDEQALRTAFDQMTRDSNFQADARRSNIDIDPSSGEEVERLVARLYSLPPATIERARRAVRAVVGSSNK